MESKYKHDPDDNADRTVIIADNKRKIKQRLAKRDAAYKKYLEDNNIKPKRRKTQNGAIESRGTIPMGGLSNYALPGKFK